MSGMIFLIIFYGFAALLREALAVFYYRAVFSQGALLASVLSLGIELVDIFILATILIRFFKYGDLLPAVVYCVCGAVGVFFAVRFKRKK